MDVDLPDVYETKVVKARKPRQCVECRRTMGVGEQYKKHTGLWDGRWSHYAMCQSCYWIHQAAEEECGEQILYVFGELFFTLKEMDLGHHVPV